MHSWMISLHTIYGIKLTKYEYWTLIHQNIFHLHEHAKMHITPSAWFMIYYQPDAQLESLYRPRYTRAHNNQGTTIKTDLQADMCFSAIELDSSLFKLLIFQFLAL